MWVREVLSLELKKRAAYVTNFWIKVIVPPIAQVGVAYFLWDSIFTNQNAETIGGYTFEGMMLYYIVASCIYQMVQPDVGIFIREIYEGTLTKFLVYPVPVILFKFIAHIAQLILVSIELVLGLLLYSLIIGGDVGAIWQYKSIILGAFAIVGAGYLFFIMASCLELLGFWVETVWGLVIMLQIITSLLGGKLIPLSLFPEWLQSSLQFTPFPYLVSFPTQVVFGAVPINEYLFGAGILLAWAAAFTVLASFIWNRGSYHYTGTGM